MERVYKQTTAYYDETLTPIACVNSGETISFHSPDCWGNNLNSSITKDELYKKGLEMNPCCGPVWINNSEVGDTLKIHIDDIQVKNGHLAIYRKEFGVLGDYLSKDETIDVSIQNGIASLYNGLFRWTIKPMLGVLAVTPKGEKQSTLLSGKYGGNMDCKLLRKGTTLYLPVQVPGALLITGDVHALQGDGEVLASLEVPAEIKLTVDVIKNKSEQWPILETEDAWYVITSALTSSDANTISLSAMADFVTTRGIYTPLQWLTIMGLRGNSQNCKVVDKYKTSRFMMPKDVMGTFKF